MDPHKSRRSIKDRMPQWREKVRMDCRNRVKESRAAILARLRGQNTPGGREEELRRLKAEVLGSVGQMVNHELQRMAGQEGGTDGDGQGMDMDTLGGNAEWAAVKQQQPMPRYQPPADGYRGAYGGEGFGSDPLGLGSDGYEDFMRSLEQELLEDFESEQEALLKELMESEDAELRALAAAGEEFLGVGAGPYVICPLCKASRLHQVAAGGTIVCTCGFRLEVRSDQVGLEYLSERLCGVWASHGETGCPAEPSFRLEERFGITALYMGCAGCQGLDLVI